MRCPSLSTPVSPAQLHPEVGARGQLRHPSTPRTLVHGHRPRHPLLCPFMGLRFCPHFFLGECRDSSKTHLGARVLRSQTFRSSRSDSTSCSRRTSGTPFLLCPLADSYSSSTSLSQLGFPCSLAQVKSLRPMPIPGSLSSFSPYFSYLLTLRRHPALRPRGIPLLWGKDWRMGTAPAGRPAMGRTAATRGMTR